MALPDLVSWLLGKAAGLIGFLPNALLRWLYPVPAMRERLAALTSGVGPHIIVEPGVPARINALEIILLNRLPFPVEVDGLRAEICLESRVLATIDKVNRLSIPPGEIGRVWLRHDLTESQAGLVRGYPEGHHPADCAILRVSGEFNIRTSFRAVSAPFSIETRAFISRGASERTRRPC